MDIDAQITQELLDLENKLHHSVDAKLQTYSNKAYELDMIAMCRERNRLKRILGKACPEMQKIYEEILELRSQVNEQLDISDDDNACDYIFININPREDVPLDMTMQVMQKVLKKKWLKDAIYVIEQRGKDLSELMKGKHIHLLIHRNGKSYYECCREIANTVQHICDVESGRASGWHKGAYECQKTTNKFVKNRLTYMLGNKATIKKKTKEYNFKDVKQEMDRVMRQRLNLQDFYSKGNIDTSGVQFYISGATTSGVDE